MICDDVKQFISSTMAKGPETPFGLLWSRIMMISLVCLGNGFIFVQY